MQQTRLRCSEASPDLIQPEEGEPPPRRLLSLAIFWWGTRWTFFPRRQDGGKSPEGLFGGRTMARLLQAQDWQCWRRSRPPCSCPAQHTPCQQNCLWTGSQGDHKSGFLEPVGSQCPMDILLFAFLNSLLIKNVYHFKTKSIKLF